MLFKCVIEVGKYIYCEKLVVINFVEVFDFYVVVCKVGVKYGVV